MTIMGGLHATRVMQAGALEFTVECSSAKLCRTVQELFQDLDPAPADCSPTRVGLLEEIIQGESRYRLVGASWPGEPTVPADIALDLFVGAINQLALDVEPDVLHLHAGVVARGHEGVIICAPSGTGKSTLTAELVRQGWQYLTDETAAVTHDGTTITGFPKPLTIKRSGRALMPDLADNAVYVDQSERTSWQVPATRLGGLAQGALQPKLVVLLTRDRSRPRSHPAEPAWTMVESADATVAMLELALDAGRYGSSALMAVANLAQRCMSVRVEAGSPSLTASLVSDLIEIAGERDVRAPQLVDRTGLDGLLAKYRVPRTVTTVVLDERAVVHDTVTRRIASFDEVGTQMWMALLDGKHELGFGAELLDSTSFVRALKAEGFLSEPTDEGATTCRSV